LRLNRNGLTPAQFGYLAEVPPELDFAHHHGFVPRLCRSYRAKTKGKVECFISYLRTSFYVPLASQLSPEGVKAAPVPMRKSAPGCVSMDLHAKLKVLWQEARITIAAYL
jgi:hypothetical protein